MQWSETVMAVLTEPPLQARVRTEVEIPLGGCLSRTWILTFDGLSCSDHFAIRFGQPASTPLVRLHSECVTGDVFGSLRCDCGFQLDEAVRMLDQAGGWLLYLRQEGRGIGLTAKVDAYRLQQHGMDTYGANRSLGYPEDAREYSDAVRMLKALSISELHLLTGNPDKTAALANGNIKIRSIRACLGSETAHSASYMAAKRARGRLNGKTIA